MKVPRSKSALRQGQKVSELSSNPNFSERKLSFFFGIAFGAGYAPGGSLLTDFIFP